MTLMDWPSKRSLRGQLSQAGGINRQNRNVSFALKEPIRDGLLAAPGASVGLTRQNPGRYARGSGGHQ